MPRGICLSPFYSPESAEMMAAPTMIRHQDCGRRNRIPHSSELTAFRFVAIGVQMDES
jgi:hypothetical protein